MGYSVYKFAVTAATKTAITIKRAVDWEPMELSFVPVPADAGATVRSYGHAGIGAADAARARMRRRAGEPDAADHMRWIEQQLASSRGSARMRHSKRPPLHDTDW